MKISVAVDSLAALKSGVIPVIAKEVEFSDDTQWAAETIAMVAKYCRIINGDQVLFTLPVMTATVAGVVEASQLKTQEEQAALDKLNADLAETSLAIESLDLELVEIDLFTTPQLLLTRAVGSNWHREAANEICKDFPEKVKFIADRQAFLAAERKRIDEEVLQRNRQASVDEEQAIVAWIDEHGSELLKRRLEIEVDYEQMYKDERLAKELPGWVWHVGSLSSLYDPQKPELSDFALLDRARVWIPDARLARIGREGPHVAYGEFLDEMVILEAQEAQEAQEATE